MSAIRQRGFTLMEMMVGITLGLLGMLAVTEALITFNASRNATTQTMESQNDGTMALYLLERDLIQAGYGLMTIQDCAVINWYYNSALQTPLATLPVSITDGGIASDSLAVQYANPSTGIPATTISQSQLGFADNLFVASIVGVAVNDLVVADVSGTCTLYSVTAVNNANSSLLHTANAYNPTSDPGAGWNLVQVSNTLANLGTDPTLNLSSRFVSRRLSVSPTGLSVGDFPSYGNSTLVDGIVYMKAQYGRDTNGDGAVDTWSSGAWIPDNTTSNQVIAVRIGVVARSQEKISVLSPTAIPLLPELKDTVGTVIGARVDYTPADTAYRYKAYSTIIPLRNVIWNN